MVVVDENLMVKVHVSGTMGSRGYSGEGLKTNHDPHKGFFFTPPAEPPYLQFDHLTLFIFWTLSLNKLHTMN